MGASPSLLQDKIAEYERDRDKRIRAYDKEREARLNLFNQDKSERLSKFEEQRQERLLMHEEQKAEVEGLHDTLKTFEKQLMKKWADMSEINLEEFEAFQAHKEAISNNAEIEEKCRQQQEEI